MYVERAPPDKGRRTRRSREPRVKVSTNHRGQGVLTHYSRGPRDR